MSTIQQVISVLDTVIIECKNTNSRLGYFAVLYKLMTIAVEKGIADGVFADGPRMERLDVVFASRYLQAYDDYKNNRPVTNSWKTAFDLAKQDGFIVVQHLLLGINAHINLDLGIAAADISTIDNINDLKADFDKINDTIADVYGGLQSRFAKISWPAIFLSKINPRMVNDVINFSIVKARDLAWANALILCNAGNNNRNTIIGSTDTTVQRVAHAITHPAAVKNFGLKIILFFESKDISKNIDILGGQ